MGEASGQSGSTSLAQILRSKLGAKGIGTLPTDSGLRTAAEAILAGRLPDELPKALLLATALDLPAQQWHQALVLQVCSSASTTAAPLSDLVAHLLLLSPVEYDAIGGTSAKAALTAISNRSRAILSGGDVPLSAHLPDALRTQVEAANSLADLALILVPGLAKRSGVPASLLTNLIRRSSTPKNIPHFQSIGDALGVPRDHWAPFVASYITGVPSASGSLSIQWLLHRALFERGLSVDAVAKQVGELSKTVYRLLVNGSALESTILRVAECLGLDGTALLRLKQKRDTTRARFFAPLRDMVHAAIQQRNLTYAGIERRTHISEKTLHMLASGTVPMRQEFPNLAPLADMLGLDHSRLCWSIAVANASGVEKSVSAVVYHAILKRGWTVKLAARETKIPLADLRNAVNDSMVPRVLATRERFPAALGIRPELWDEVCRYSIGRHRIGTSDLEQVPNARALRVHVMHAIDSSGLSPVEWSAKFQFGYKSVRSVLDGNVPKRQDFIDRLTDVLKLSTVQMAAALRLQSTQVVEQAKTGLDPINGIQEALLRIVEQQHWTTGELAERIGVTELTTRRVIKHGWIPVYNDVRTKIRTFLGMDLETFDECSRGISDDVSSAAEMRILSLFRRMDDSQRARVIYEAEKLLAKGPRP